MTTRRPVGRVLRMSYLAASVAGVGFFVLSVAWLGVWPARQLKLQAEATTPAVAIPLTESEQRGRAIYAREGCGYCHTQQVRYTATDARRFGAPTMAWETVADTPHIMGTRRIGPDLARTYDTRSIDWQYQHLFAPRSVVSTSVMPAYPQMFDGAPDRPLQEAQDLVAYLETLGRARVLAGPEGEAKIRAVASHDHMWEVGSDVTPVVGNPARTRRTGVLPVLTPEVTQLLPWNEARNERGRELYQRHCASCHGETMAGDGPGGAGPTIKPTALSERWYRTERLLEALWHGVPGTAMPAWRDLPLSDIEALIVYVQQPTSILREDQIGEAPAPDAVERGARLYAANCAQCHGPEGRGDGPSADALKRAPTNFTVQKLSFPGVIGVLEQGVAGSMMAPWGTRLSREDMAALAHHVRGFYR